MEQLCRAAAKGGKVRIALEARGKALFLQAQQRDGAALAEEPLDPLFPDDAALELARRLSKMGKV